ncbi:MAG TPA: patatin-like phospholipase family protein [Syntrophales bacterium]|jgi:NTE family protein|nr:patatin-like phospholipase family protein [Syntrophales bacterium]HRT61965.1 patatin-like phospholipase family protein [Syntrophales bacterium]
MGNGREATHRIGLALGSGSSRGWAHIGVIRALSEVGIEPDIVCGCSVGALVGASYSTGMLDRLEQWVISLTKLEFARFFEINLSLTGFIDTERLHAFLAGYVCDEEDRIETLAKTYAAVSTELETGREIWFTQGPVMEAVRASISIPGLFPPLFHGGKWLVDGGLVNPVPVSLCRSLGADIVIAVNLNGDIVSKLPKQKDEPAESESIVERFAKTFRSYSTTLFPGTKPERNPPALIDAIALSLNIMQDRVTRSRMAGDPPDIHLAPKLSHIGLLEAYRGKEAIREGRECVRRMLPEIQYVLGMTPQDAGTEKK